MLLTPNLVMDRAREGGEKPAEGAPLRLGRSSQVYCKAASGEKEEVGGGGESTTGGSGEQAQTVGGVVQETEGDSQTASDRCQVTPR